ncbi:hypothetical protein SAMN05661008_00341 [Alkalithermobacter thermoalcaliphilus JW-YL-7 = DSM 7308]|uniref:Uncharacterized protein n=1 Tax=Alkalithermobacter thermoalcaliphilus JW-YL-7 = DSM 7308 TaxID=1121328 RepID=A0A150FPB0_CLOPD|nr:hypothetical protein JWYL7_0548 [[Clostridium] paradoxum JW-YL-7 = DSM 7308]SHK50345.1 hypothetical protein SAMN05661008_00341 [[Clostridium] paradoxum JW-YL-7 = DSM 7308]
MKEKKRVEKQKHRDAFELYSKLKMEGEKDVPEKVAKEFGITVRTVNQWSSDFSWKEKMEEIERKTSEEAHKKMIKEIAKRKEKSLVFLMEYMQKMEVQMMLENKDNYYAKDYTEILKNFLLLTGEATERTENTNINTNKISEEDREAINNLSNAIRMQIEKAGGE